MSINIKSVCWTCDYKEDCKPYLNKLPGALISSCFNHQDHFKAMANVKEVEVKEDERNECHR